jgi:hypothetical protein
VPGTAPAALPPLSPCLAQTWCLCCLRPHDMETCMEARRNCHPMLLSWSSEKDLAAIQAALAVEGEKKLEKKLSEDREARTAKWREEVKARGSFY